jgi:hypothetical protein
MLLTGEREIVHNEEKLSSTSEYVGKAGAIQSNPG